MLRLHTFGSTYLGGPTGAPLAGAATQRRTLALLAVLAVSETGLSRDKLIALLWPEVDSERARHSLTQALYAARRAVGVDDLFVAGGVDVRLNPDRLASDVREFELAIQAGDLERAAMLYEGPFLDGFFLSGSPEFEQWSTAQRTRLESKAAESLDRLAARAEERGDHRAALDWRRRLATLLPLDASHAAKLMSAMAAVGDRAGAVQHARVHATMLREQLDLEPDPVVEELAAALRDAAAWPSSAPAVSSPRALAPAEAHVVGAERPAHLDRAGHPSDGTTAVGVWVPTRRRPALPPWVRRLVVAGLLLVLVGLGALIGRAGRSSAPALRELPVRQRIVVAPFRVSGADASLGYLREGIVELLSARLADDTAARSVDAGAVLGAWRVAGLTGSNDVPRDTVVRRAARLGAERVVVGSVVGTPRRVVLGATLLLVPQGTVSAQASVSGPADSITTLIERLAAQLLVAEAGQDESLAHYTSRSLPALKAFLAGQAAFRQYDYAEAIRHYDRALRRDSSFALAALYKALAADRLSLAPQLRSGVAVAWAARGDLGARDLSQLLAMAGPRYPALPTTAEQTAAWQQIVDLAPASADAWYALSARLLKDGAAAGVEGWRARAVATLQRALAANAAHLPARQLLAPLAGHAPPAGSPEGAPPGGVAIDSLAPLSPSTLWHAAAVAGDTARLRALRRTVPRLGDADLRAIALTSQLEGIELEDGARALAALRARAMADAGRIDVVLAEHSLALNQGRTADALDATDRLRPLQSGQDAWLRLRVLDALYAAGDSAAGADAARRLAEATAASPLRAPTSWDGWLANACVVAQWRLSRGDTSRVRGTLDVLRARRTISPSTRVSAAPEACAALLEASLAVGTRRRDARADVVRLDSLVFTPQVAGDAATYAPLVVMRLYERLGDPASALTALRERGHPATWPRYAATMWYEEGRLAQRMGDAAGARSAYTRFLAYRSGDSPASDPQVVQAHEALTALDAAPR